MSYVLCYGSQRCGRTQSNLGSPVTRTRTYIPASDHHGFSGFPGTLVRMRFTDRPNRLVAMIGKAVGGVEWSGADNGCTSG